VVWDRPGLRPVHDDVRWLDLEALTPPRILRFVPPPPLSQIVKRGFDLAFALGVLAVTWPLWLIVALAILIEDGRPITFGHRRETIGGRPFNCLKFRSMRKDAEKLKAKLAAMNQADGPQFFIEDDPRLTGVGRFIRKYQIDELPQFLNVLRGEMSVVGPRPSPYAENQYCPGWREARLSVRPGITGLWQVKRTRSAGTDFQEWIRYDIEYVERQSFWFDLSIIARTVLSIVRRFTNP
jgi:lipopolysaccharide/colanic/teichoic acid biosynthesis glycosyltransferase